MNRRQFFKQAGVAGVGAAALAAPAIAQENPKITWRLASSFPKSLDIIFGAATDIAESVSKATDGQFEIQVFAAGEIVPPLQVADAVTADTIEMGHTCCYYYIGKDPAFALGTAIPFGLNARMTNSWFTAGGGNELLNEFLASYKLYALPAGNTGAQMGGWYRKEIKTIDDLKGLKMRIAGLAGEIMSKVGVTPQQIAGSDVYPALEKGTLDAAEWVGPYDDQKLGFYKVAPFYHYPGWWEGGPQLDLYVNTKAYEGLSAENKAIIENASAYAHTEMQAKYDARNPTALRQLVANKTKLVSFNKAVLDAAFKESMALYSEIAAKNPNWKKVYEDYSKFRRDSNQWFRFTEARFDSYMQSQKL